MREILQTLSVMDYKDIPCYQKKIFWAIVEHVMQEDDRFFKQLLYVVKNKITKDHLDKKAKIITDERVED